MKRSSLLTHNRFIDAIHDDPERLPITSTLLQHLFDVYEISPRFANLIKRQHMPGRALHYDETGQPLAYGKIIVRNSNSILIKYRTVVFSCPSDSA